jgi:hypothetical protein
MKKPKHVVCCAAPKLPLRNECLRVQFTLSPDSTGGHFLDYIWYHSPDRRCTHHGGLPGLAHKLLRTATEM